MFANLRRNKQVNRFTLRSQTKVDGQWKLYVLVHNIEKRAHHAYAQKSKSGNYAKGRAMRQRWRSRTRQAAQQKNEREVNKRRGNSERFDSL